MCVISLRGHVINNAVMGADHENCFIFSSHTFLWYHISQQLHLVLGCFLNAFFRVVCVCLEEK